MNEIATNLSKNINVIFLGILSSICTIITSIYGLISTINLSAALFIPIAIVAFSAIGASLLWPLEKLRGALLYRLKIYSRYDYKKVSIAMVSLVMIAISFSRAPFLFAERVLDHTQLCDLNRACVGWVHYADFQDVEGDYTGIGQALLPDFILAPETAGLEQACPARVDPTRSITLRENVSASYWAPAQIEQSVDDALQFTPSPINTTQNICTDEQDTSCQTVLREAQLEEGDRVRILSCARLSLNNSEYELWVQIRDQNFNEWRHQNDG